MEVKFFVDKKELLNAMKQISSCIDSKIDNVTQGVLFDVKKDKIIISGTNAIVYGKEEIKDVEIIKEGKILIEYKLLKNLLNNFPDKKVKFIYDSTKSSGEVLMAYKNIKYTIPTYEVDMFPEEPKPKKDVTTFDIEQSELKTILKRLEKTISSDSNKPAMQGIYIDICKDDQLINFVSTDTYRLQKYEYSPDNLKVRSKKSCIIYTETIKFLKGILNNTEDKIEIKIDDNHLITQVGTTTLKSTLIVEDRFPKYQQVIPKDFEGELTIDTNTITNALKRTNQVLRHNKSSVVSLNVDNEIKVRAMETQFSQGEDIVEILNKKLNQDFTISFNIKYLLDYFTQNKNENTEVKVVKGCDQLLFVEENLVYIALAVRTI